MILNRHPQTAIHVQFQEVSRTPYVLNMKRAIYETTFTPNITVIQFIFLCFTSCYDVQVPNH